MNYGSELRNLTLFAIDLGLGMGLATVFNVPLFASFMLVSLGSLVLGLLYLWRIFR